jgi:hypothetical protein
MTGERSQMTWLRFFYWQSMIASQFVRAGLAELHRCVPAQSYGIGLKFFLRDCQQV